MGEGKKSIFPVKQQEAIPIKPKATLKTFQLIEYRIIGRVLSFKLLESMMMLTLGL